MVPWRLRESESGRSEEDRKFLLSTVSKTESSVANDFSRFGSKYAIFSRNGESETSCSSTSFVIGSFINRIEDGKWDDWRNGGYWGCGKYRLFRRLRTVILKKWSKFRHQNRSNHHQNVQNSELRQRVRCSNAVIASVVSEKKIAVVAIFASKKTRTVKRVCFVDAWMRTLRRWPWASLDKKSAAMR